MHSYRGTSGCMHVLTEVLSRNNMSNFLLKLARRLHSPILKGESKLHLKVGIYPYIPDLNRDQLKGLRRFVKQEFEKQYPCIDLNVTTDWNPYSVEKVAGYLTSHADSFDVLEMDTILLGEVVDEGVVQQLDLARYDLNNVLFPAALDAVTYKRNCYGVPTLHCANFLMELMVSDVPPSETEICCPLEKGEHSVEDLKKMIHRYHGVFEGVSPLVGNFRGKWELPLLFMDAYIDKYGKDSADEAVDALIDLPDNTDVLENIKWFMGLGDSLDGTNKGESGEYSDGPPVKDIVESDHIMMYGFSEWLSQIKADKLAKKKHIHASCIISPPLGAENNLLTFTDALVVNKSHFAEQKKRQAIDMFIKFYTSLTFRNKYAEGQDLKEPHPPRYVLVSRKDFYTEGLGARNKKYRELYKALSFATACPNHGIVDQHKELYKLLVDKLDLPPSTSD